MEIVRDTRRRELAIQRFKDGCQGTMNLTKRMGAAFQFQEAYELYDKIGQLRLEANKITMWYFLWYGDTGILKDPQQVEITPEQYLELKKIYLTTPHG